ncbi:MAG: cobalt-precorrin-5B (C(1))-methyltransferase [Lachnospiraceae bacterium]|nr:cobalt-precorrin-5B (C(1))-methyltransferase [Lachnospiraceae bacterium]
MADAPVVVCSNFIGEAIDETISDDFEKVFIIGHAGKLVKLAGGIMNTHSGMADCRMELICAHAAICGADTQTCRQIMELTTTDAAFSFLEDRSQELRTKVIGSLYRKIEYHLGERVRKHEKDSSIRIEAVMFVKHDGRNILL